MTKKIVNRVCFDLTLRKNGDRHTLWQELHPDNEADVEGFTKVCVNLLEMHYDVHETWVEKNVEVEIEQSSS